jgi:RNA polymerase sigma-70 factor (ECF subfamily)
VRDPTWFDALLEEHLGALFRAALHLCAGQATDAEDLLHDTALRALRSRGQLRAREAGRTWLFRILATTHLNRIRTAKRRGEALATDMSDSDFENALSAWTPLAGPEEALIATLRRDALMDALARMTPELRAALWLSDAEGFTHKEVASMLSVPEGTVASRVFRARQALRALIDQTQVQRGGVGAGA